MKLINRKFIIVIIMIFCFSIPIVLAIYESTKQSLRATESLLLGYAHDVLRRSEQTAEQVAIGIERLGKIKGSSPCSKKSINLMREIDISSGYLQAIGYVKNNILICSSIGDSGVHLNLGPVDKVTSFGSLLRLNVTLLNKTKGFVVIERDHYAAIIYKDLPIDTAPLNTALSLALFTLEGYNIYTSRGFIDKDWFQGVTNSKDELTFVKNGYVVTLVKSTKFKFAALAAMPFSSFNENTIKSALILVPIGCIAGLIITWLFFYWVRLQMSPSSALKSGLKNNEFFLVYQPVYDVQTKRCVGAEALMRWKRPNDDLICPDVFIPIAEDSDLIKQLTHRAIDIIAEETALLFKSFPDFYISLNVSEADLHSEHLVIRFFDLIQQTKAEPKNFIIEATERKFMNPDEVNQTLNALRNMGLKIAIDDFGTGYSSLSYLESLNVDYLKIDKSFVSAVGTDAPTSHVILHIIEMAKSLNLKIIAEGIENQEQEELISQHGVHFAQGWLYSAPLTINELLFKLNLHPPV
jgi:sensor c-di-GMP phosphodiesterase-like protein